MGVPMKVVAFNRPKAIWEILNEYQLEGRLDKHRVELVLNPIDKGQIRISAAFLDNFYSDTPNQVACQSREIYQIINAVANQHLEDTRIIQKKLRHIGFSTFSILEDLRSLIKPELYNKAVYEVFKKLLFETSDKEIFKLAIEMTGQCQWCEQLLDAYLIIGQCEEFTRYVASGVVKWIYKSNFKEVAFKLLSLSNDWGTIYLTELLLEEEELLQDMTLQRSLLIGSLTDNSLLMEVTAMLGKKLNLLALLEQSLEDEELFKYIVEFFNALFSDTTSNGGIWAVMGHELGLLEAYITTLVKVKFDTIQLLGIRELYEFIKAKETKNYIYAVFDNIIYENIKVKVEALWQATYSIELLKKSLREKVDLFGWCMFIKTHKVIEVLEECKALYNQDNIFSWLIEDTLIEIGDMDMRLHIYDQLKKLIEDEKRKVESYSYVNIWGEGYERENEIINKIKVLEKLPFEEIVACSKSLLKDYNPQVRSRVLLALDVRAEADIKADEELVEAIINRLADSPFYVRNEALELCTKKHIKISKLQVQQIEESWKQRSEKNNQAFYKNFHELQDKPIKLVSYKKCK